MDAVSASTRNTIHSPQISESQGNLTNFPSLPQLTEDLHFLLHEADERFHFFAYPIFQNAHSWVSRSLGNGFSARVSHGFLEALEHDVLKSDFILETGLALVTCAAGSTLGNLFAPNRFVLRSVITALGMKYSGEALASLAHNENRFTGLGIQDLRSTMNVGAMEKIGLLMNSFLLPMKFLPRPLAFLLARFSGALTMSAASTVELGLLLSVNRLSLFLGFTPVFEEAERENFNHFSVRSLTKNLFSDLGLHIGRSLAPRLSEINLRDRIQELIRDERGSLDIQALLDALASPILKHENIDFVYVGTGVEQATHIHSAFVDFLENGLLDIKVLRGTAIEEMSRGCPEYLKLKEEGNARSRVCIYGDANNEISVVHLARGSSILKSFGLSPSASLAKPEGESLIGHTRRPSGGRGKKHRFERIDTRDHLLTHSQQAEILAAVDLSHWKKIADQPRPYGGNPLLTLGTVVLELASLRKRINRPEVYLSKLVKVVDPNGKNCPAAIMEAVGIIDRIGFRIPKRSVLTEKNDVELQRILRQISANEATARRFVYYLKFMLENPDLFPDTIEQG